MGGLEPVQSKCDIRAVCVNCTCCLIAKPCPTAWQPMGALSVYIRGELQSGHSTSSNSAHTSSGLKRLAHCACRMEGRASMRKMPCLLNAQISPTVGQWPAADPDDCRARITMHACGVDECVGFSGSSTLMRRTACRHTHANTHGCCGDEHEFKIQRIFSHINSSSSAFTLCL